MEIENVSYIDIVDGNHTNRGEDTILIRILDTDNENPAEPKSSFFKIISFKFLDCDENAGLNDKFLFNSDMAKEIVEIFEICKKENKNIVVHCTAGICRSGAITEVGEMFGFKVTKNSNRRIPNTLVKKLLLSELGWGY